MDWPLWKLFLRKEFIDGWLSIDSVVLRWPWQGRFTCMPVQTQYNWLNLQGSCWTSQKVFSQSKRIDGPSRPWSWSKTRRGSTFWRREKEIMGDGTQTRTYRVFAVDPSHAPPSHPLYPSCNRCVGTDRWPFVSGRRQNGMTFSPLRGYIYFRVPNIIMVSDRWILWVYSTTDADFYWEHRPLLSLSVDGTDFRVDPRLFLGEFLFQTSLLSSFFQQNTNIWYLI